MIKCPCYQCSGQTFLCCVKVCQTSQTDRQFSWTMWLSECPAKTTGIEAHPKVPLTVGTMQGDGVRDKVALVQLCPVQNSQTSWTIWSRECPVESTGIQAQHKVSVNVGTMQGLVVWETRWHLWNYVMALCSEVCTAKWILQTKLLYNFFLYSVPPTLG